MIITFYSTVTTEEKCLKYISQIKEHTFRIVRLDERERLLRECSDTEILVVDAMGTVDREIIDSMPELRLIHSEGVGYQGVDVAYAAEKGIAVCNNKGINDTAVAEDALLLMLGCLKSIITGHQCVYDGRQIEVKKASFGVIRELGECTVGLVGFGDIARKTAELCNAFGANVIYTNRTRYKELEEKYNVSYTSLDELLKQSDFVSLHLAVTDDTREIADTDFFAKMKSNAYLINTSRGDLVNNEALLGALLNGELAGAGLDVISPEPVESDNILLDKRIADKLVLTPHIAGITHLTVKKLYLNIWDNINRFIKSEPLKNRVG